MQGDAIDEIKNEIEKIQNPILHSHQTAKDALKMLFRKIESSNDIYLEIDSEIKQYMEVLKLWDKQGLLSGQREIQGWVSVYLKDPFFLMAVYSEKYGNYATLDLHQRVWDIIKQEKKIVHGQNIAENFNVPLPYISALFKIFESEGKGETSAEIGSCYFIPDPDLC